MGSSFLPEPTATTVPFCGFSFAVSGMMMPAAVFFFGRCWLYDYPIG